MNTKPKRIIRPVCEECGEVFEIVENTPILLAFPRPPTQTQSPYQDDKGKCPKHPRSLSNES